MPAKTPVERVAATVLAITIGLAASTSPRAEERPNIIVIYTDDQKYDEIGYFNEDILSPNIDRLFADGARFVNARVTTSMCTPSRYSLHTGQYASRGVVSTAPKTLAGPLPVEFNMELRPGDTTLGEVLQRAGYRTGFVGKWHLGGPRDLEEFAEGDAGKNLPSADLLEAKRTYDSGLIAEMGGFDYVAGLYIDNPASMPERHNLPVSYGVHNPEWVTQGAIGFIREAREEHAGQPLFLLIATTLPHAPLYSNDDDPLATPYGALLEAPEVQSARKELEREVRSHLGPDRARRLVRTAESVALLDAGVGAVLAELERLGIEEDTLIFFMSDNAGGKGSVYEAGVRVPAAAYWPGRLEPGDRKAMIANIDVLPTLAELAGQADAGGLVDGESFLRPLLSRGGMGREELLLEAGYARAVVTDDGWKYIAVRFPDPVLERPQSGRIDQLGRQEGNARLKAATERVEDDHPAYFDADQLYDLTADPDEQVNLAADPQFARKLEEMRERLRDEVLKTDPAFAAML